MRRRASLAFVLFFVSAIARAQDAEITHPVAVHQVDARYPDAVAPTHADVILVVTLDAQGNVTDVKVETSGGTAFDDAAMAAVRQWTFSPATKDGKPFAARMKIPFHFEPTHERPAETIAPPPPPPANPKSVTVAKSVAHAATVDDVTDVRVYGRAALPHVGVSDIHFVIGELFRARGSPSDNASKLLQSATPILLTNEGGEGHAEQVFLRGFDAGEGQDIELSVDGIPINESGNLHGNGYADTHFIIPELVSSLRVVEGPYDPRQGNYAVAGSADYELGLPKRGFLAKYTGGSFNTQRGLVLWGPEGESERTFVGGELYSTDGYGQNRDAVRGSAMAQYEGKLGDNGVWRAGAQAYATHYHAAGLIREDDYKAGRIGFYDSYDFSTFAREAVPQGGDASRYSVWAALEKRAGDTTFGQQAWLIKRDMRLLENFTGFLLDVQQPLQSLHAQRGDEIDLNVDSTSFGARGFARFRARALDQRQELELGYFARGDVTHGTQQRLEAATGIPYLTETDLQATLGDIGFYADANLRATKWLNVRGGARSDIFTYDVLDNCAAHTISKPSTTNPPIDQSCLDQYDAGGNPAYREPNQRTTTASIITMPRASVIVGPFTGFSFSASIGEGVRSVDPSYVIQNTGTPFATLVAYEGGASYAHTFKDAIVAARSVFFSTHVDQDLIFDPNAGRNVIGAGTTRSGWVGAARVTGKHFDEAASVTFVRSTYDDTHLLVAYVPDAVFRSDTAVFGDLPIKIAGTKLKGSIGLGITYVGPRALPFNQRSDDIFTLDATASVAWRNIELGVTGTNITNNQYRLGEYNFASDFHSQAQPTLVPERSFTAGPPLAIFGNLTIRWGAKP
jgi:TonB family protein